MAVTERRDELLTAEYLKQIREGDKPNHSRAARVARCKRSAARQFHAKFAAELQTRARAQLAEEQRHKDDARSDAIAQLQSDAVLCRNVANAANASMGTLAQMIPGLRLLVQDINKILSDPAQKAKIAGDPREAMQVVRQFTNAFARSTEIADRAQAMLYRTLGKPTDILSVQSEIDQEMSDAEVERTWIAIGGAIAANKRLRTARGEVVEAAAMDDGAGIADLEEVKLPRTIQGGGDAGMVPVPEAPDGARAEGAGEGPAPARRALVSVPTSAFLASAPDRSAAGGPVGSGPWKPNPPAPEPDDYELERERAENRTAELAKAGFIQIR